MTTSGMLAAGPAGARTGPGARPLPFIVGGRRIEPSATGPAQRVSMRFGEALLPVLSREHTDQMLAADRQLLAGIPVQEILSLLNRVGRLWKSREYPRRSLFIRHLHEHLGYSEKMAVAEADWIASILKSHARLWDQLDVELGSRFILDEWVRREECYVRAFPRGLSVHISAGNVPTAAIATAVRALLTKNAVVLKPAADDLVTALAFALSLRDLDRNHPVTRSVSVVYWPHDDGEGRRLVAGADAVCVWGGEDALTWAHRHTAPQAAFLPFGPKRSLAVVGRVHDAATAATAVAHDVCMYDQRACFSVQQLFVERPADALLAALPRGFERYDRVYPRGRRTDDEVAGASLGRLSDEFFGAACTSGGDSGWTIVRCSPHVPARHPLGRYLYVHEVDSLEEVARYVDGTVQTVGVMPWELCATYRDAWARAGAARFVELGLNNLFRAGTSHDDMYPMGRLVRFVSCESPSSTHGKGMTLEIDLTELLAKNELADVVQ